MMERMNKFNPETNNMSKYPFNSSQASELQTRPTVQYKVSSGLS